MNLRKRITAWMLPLIVSLALGVPVAASFVIPNASVTSAKLAAGAAAANIGNNGVTQAMRVALGQQVSSSCGAFSTGSASYVDVTNLSVTITTTGRPVFVGLINDLAGTGSSMYNSSFTMQVKFLRDATNIGEYFVTIAGASYAQPYTIDLGAAAGSHTYKLQAKQTSGGSATASFWDLIAFEL